MEKLMKIMAPLVFSLQMFNNTNVTGDSGLSVENKTYYDKELLINAKPVLVHNQFGQKRPIPKKGGKTIEFRKFDPLPKALTALTEGVTPNGLKVAVTAITATVAQYGAYVEHSDVLDLTAIDPVISETNKLLGQQAGETLDTITREIINGGTSVLLGNAQKSARMVLVSDDATWANNDYFNCESIRQIRLALNNTKAPKIGGKYVIIIHPDAEYTLKRDAEWQEAVKYMSNEKIFKGEIGEYDGCRIVVTTEAKIFNGADLTAASRNLTMASLATKTFTVQEAISTGEATALVGRKLIIKGYPYTVASAASGAAGAATVTVNETVSGSPTAGEKLYPGEGAAKGRPAFSALGIGDNAYGTIDIEGGALQMIVKQLGSAGTADPLNQRGSQGWKAIHTAKILSELFMVRLEHTSPFVRTAN